MRLMLLVFFMAVGLFANEVKVDGSYSKMLGNPFKEVLETKTQNISILETEAKLINLNVETNRNDFSFRKPELSVMSNACNIVLKTFVSEDYNVVTGASKNISCEILPSTVVKIDYAMKEDHSFINQISDIVVHLVIRINDNGNISEEMIDMNKELNLKGALNYGLSIRAVLNLDTRNLEEYVHTILEYATYDILNKKLKR